MFSRRRDWLLGLLLMAATLIAYQPVWHAGFIWDDNKHITLPGLRSLQGLPRIWTQLGATPQYYPFVHTVFWMEYQLWAGAPLGYHLINVLLHGVSALLLVKILRQLKIPGAWLAAALFALHPVEVESVAWISELKNTLSGVFYLSAALAYLGFDRNRNWQNYIAALGLFALGLMSKTVIASLPAALLVVFWWQRGKLSWKREVLPLAPFFIAGIWAGLLTAWVERKFIGAEGAEFHFSLIERFLIAGRDIWFYLGKLFWPVNLTFIYPRWIAGQTVWWQYLFPAAVLLLMGMLAWRGRRGALAGLLFFIGTLFPALGFFNVYPFRFSFVADHFQYLASLGPLTLAAAGMSAHFRKSQWICAPLLLVLGVMTWRQCGMYANAETLWQETIRRNPGCWMAHYNLGIALDQKGRVDEAITQYREALEINADDAAAHNNLGTDLFQKGKVDEAMLHYQETLRINPHSAEAHLNLGSALQQKGNMAGAMTQYQEALAINPDYADAHNNLGNLLRQMGRVTEAIPHFQQALALNPADAKAHNNLGMAFQQEEKPDEAIAQYQNALQITPDDADAHNNLGAALRQKGSVDEAIQQYQAALKINPGSARAHYNLGNAFLQKGNTSEAIAHFEKSLVIEPAQPPAQNNLAWLLSTCPEATLRNGRRAVELAQQANALTGGENPLMLHTLAASLAEAGRFPEAMETARHALRLAEAQANGGLAGALQLEMKLYQAGKPFHSPGPGR